MKLHLSSGNSSNCHNHKMPFVHSSIHSKSQVSEAINGRFEFSVRSVRFVVQYRILSVTHLAFIRC